MIKNLLYRLTPFTGSNYLLNLQELLKRFHIFNGRRIIAVAQGDGCDHIEIIKEIMGALGSGIAIEFFTVPIEDTLWENTTFIPSLTKLKADFDPRSITFYAHNKGSTRSKPAHVLKGYEGDIAVYVWLMAMYKYNLDQPYLNQIEHYFKRGIHTVGSFRRIGTWPHFHPDSKWHYSGNFWWVRTSELFKRDWTKILPTKFGPEGYIGSLFKLQESACIYADKMLCTPYKAECMKKLGLLP